MYNSYFIRLKASSVYIQITSSKLTYSTNIFNYILSNLLGYLNKQ